MPQRIQKRISKHDRNCREIVYGLFNYASRYTEATLLPDVCISRKLWRWMTTNSDQIETILSILLRSFRVRAALGRGQWQSLMSDIESVPLVTPAPPVPATYFLRGYADPTPWNFQWIWVTVGEQLEYFGLWAWAHKGALVNTRGTYDTPLYRGKRKSASPNNLGSHECLAHEDIDHISYTLLSVLEVIDLSNS